jgi:hypothetical protein
MKCTALYRIFHRIKKAPAKRKREFYTSPPSKNEGLEGLLYEAAKIFDSFSKFKIK